MESQIYFYILLSICLSKLYKRLILFLTNFHSIRAQLEPIKANKTNYKSSP